MYYVVFVACSIVFIPYGPFCIAIGFIFGVYWGFLIQMGAILLSSAVLFIVGRYLFKDYVITLPAPPPAPSHPASLNFSDDPVVVFPDANHGRVGVLQVNDLISKSDGSQVWKGLMKYMDKDWKEVMLWIVSSSSLLL